MKKLILALSLLVSTSSVFANPFDVEDNDFQIITCVDKVSYTFKTIGDSFYFKSRRFDVFELVTLKEGKITGAWEFNTDGLKQFSDLYKQMGKEVSFVYGTKQALDNEAFINFFKDTKGEVYSLIHTPDGKITFLADTVYCKTEHPERYENK